MRCVTMICAVLTVAVLAGMANQAWAESARFAIRDFDEDSIEITGRNGEVEVMTRRQLQSLIAPDFRPLGVGGDDVESLEAEEVEEAESDEVAHREDPWGLRAHHLNDRAELNAMDTQTRQRVLRERREAKEEAAAEAAAEAAENAPKYESYYNNLRWSEDPVYRSTPERANDYNPMSWYAKPKPKDQPQRTYYKKGKYFVDVKSGKKYTEKQLEGTNAHLLISEKVYKRDVAKN